MWYYTLHVAVTIKKCESEAVQAKTIGERKAVVQAEELCSIGDLDIGKLADGLRYQVLMAAFEAEDK